VKRAIVTLAFLLGLLVSPAFGQTQATGKFHIAVDTAGVMPMGPAGVYVTWIYALATPTSWPSSGILVAFDCQNRKVKRLASVVYSMKADSTGVEGPIYEYEGEWVDVSIPRLFDLVCAIGPTHGPSVVEPTVPKAGSPYSAPKEWRIS
jgi:hypothetical protein